MHLPLPHKIIVAPTHREAFRLRAELLGGDAVADRATRADTDFVAANIARVLGSRLQQNVLEIGVGNGAFLKLALLTPPLHLFAALDLTTAGLVALKREVPQEFAAVAGVSENLPFATGTFSAER